MRIRIYYDMSDFLDGVTISNVDIMKFLIDTIGGSVNSVKASEIDDQVRRYLRS